MIRVAVFAAEVVAVVVLVLLFVAAVNAAPWVIVALAVLVLAVMVFRDLRRRV